VVSSVIDEAVGIEELADDLEVVLEPIEPFGPPVAERPGPRPHRTV
jgi:hypothetical protein